MEAAVSPFPDDLDALKTLLVSALQKADEAEARLANARARESATEAVIAHLKLQIAKLRREQYGASAERTLRLLEQMELQLEDLEGDATQDDLIAEAATAKTASVTASSASGRRGSRFPSTCRGHALSCRHRAPAPLAAARASRSWAKT
jgi:transposase